MAHRRAAVSACVLVCLAVLAAYAIPYLVTQPSAVDVYYRAPVAGMGLVGVFTLLVLLSFVVGPVAGLDPVTLAGGVITLGTFVFLLTVWWVVTLPAHVVMELTTVDEFAYHRWLLVVLAALLLLSGLWYTRSVWESPPTRGAPG